MRRTVPPSAEIEAQIDRLLAVGVGENPRESLSELARLGARLIIQRAVEDEFDESGGDRRGVALLPALRSDDSVSVVRIAAARAEANRAWASCETIWLGVVDSRTRSAREPAGRYLQP